VSAVGQALLRLRNVIGRLDAPWTPATAEEGFEIVRRRLFEPMLDADHVQADATWWRVRSSNCIWLPAGRVSGRVRRQTEYEKRIRAAYPIHPEVFTRLYEDWSTLVKFQRTRACCV
jgi:predicted AAA+ superfamily ATPase